MLNLPPLTISLFLFLLATTALGAQAEENNLFPSGSMTFPASQISPIQDKQLAKLRLRARIAENKEFLQKGLVWRMFSIENSNNKPALTAEIKSAEAEFILKPGNYLLHVSFGRAAITKYIVIEAGKDQDETITLNAGALKLDSTTQNGTIHKSMVSFSVYDGIGNSNKEALIMQNIKPDMIIRLNAGDYHIVSSYGNDNAITQSNIKIEAGKLTEATLQHQAAQITLKLVRHMGGEALADTSWVIMNGSGDLIREIANAYASVILLEGDYIAVVKNKDQIYQKEFSVSSGEDQEIEVLAVPQNSSDQDEYD